VQSLGSQLDPFLLKAISVAGDAAADTSSLTHGTAMAETILRAISQAAGGSSPGRILPIDVYGASATATSWNVAQGIKAAVDNGATIINLSLAGPSDSAILNSVIQQAIAAGIPVYAAAGNQPVTTPMYPAAAPGVISVTALQQAGQLASYANYGSWVDLALPGASVVYLGGQAYVVQGTSPATAYATGVAAGTKGVNCLPWAQIQSAMQQKFAIPK
jgi:thermitase